MGKNKLIKHDRLPVVYNPVSRRMFLHGLGGALIAIPFLGSLIPRVALAATENDYRRLAFMVFRYGVHWYDWEPTNVGYAQIAPNLRAGSLQSASLGRVFTPEYDSLKSKMSVLLGLDGVGNGDHTYASAMAASLYPQGKNEEYSTNPDSIDTVLARKIYPNGSNLRVLRMDGYGSGTFTHCMVGGRRTPAIGDSQGVFNAVAPNIVLEQTTTPVLSEAQKLAARNKLAVDRALASANKTKQSGQLSSEEGIILSNYLDMLADISANIMVGAPTGGSTSTGSPAMCKGPVYQADGTDHNGKARNMVDAMVLALACGVTKIAYMKLGDNHNTAHPIDSDSGRTAHINSIRHNALPMPVYAMKKMDAIIESNGKTLLENSALVLTSDEGSSKFDNHIIASLPVLVGGGLNGKLRMGEVIDYRNFSRGPVIPAQTTLTNGLHGGRAYNEFLITLMRSFGLTQPDYFFNNQAGYGTYQSYVTAGNNVLINNYLRDVYLAENRTSLDKPLAYYYRG